MRTPSGRRLRRRLGRFRPSRPETVHRSWAARLRGSWRSKSEPRPPNATIWQERQFEKSQDPNHGCRRSKDTNAFGSSIFLKDFDHFYAIALVDPSPRIDFV